MSNTHTLNPAATRGTFLILAVPLLLAATSHAAFADSSGMLRITPESVVRYLHQDLFISPGIGFRKVRIGHTFEQVEQAWGKPGKAHNSDVGSKVDWVYPLGRDSKITVTGSTTVETIVVTGSFNSPFSSSEGANFGMTPHQVIGIYGKPAGDQNLVKLRYPDKGIVFGFKSGALQSMRIFAPG